MFCVSQTTVSHGRGTHGQLWLLTCKWEPVTTATQVPGNKTTRLSASPPPQPGLSTWALLPTPRLQVLHPLPCWKDISSKKKTGTTQGPTSVRRPLVSLSPWELPGTEHPHRWFSLPQRPNSVWHAADSRNTNHPGSLVYNDMAQAKLWKLAERIY